MVKESSPDLAPLYTSVASFFEENKLKSTLKAFNKEAAGKLATKNAGEKVNLRDIYQFYLESQKESSASESSSSSSADSSDDSSDESSDEDSPVVAQSSESSESSESSDESSESESSDESSESEASQASSSSESESSEASSSESSDDEEETTTSRGVKRAHDSDSASSSDSEDSSDSDSDSDAKPVTPSVPEKHQAKKQRVEPSVSAPATPTGRSTGANNNKDKSPATPFRRVKAEEVEVDERLRDNSYEAKSGAQGAYGERANNVLKFTKGKSFRHEKTKKKRGGYRGGSIDTEVHSIIYDSD